MELNQYMKKVLKVLIACEESQAVTKEFRRLGHEAYSCDLFECSGGHPEWHLQQDVTNLLQQDWDLVIAFPPCTHLAVSGARWFPEKIKNGTQQAAIDFFKIFSEYKGRIAIENPVGIMSNRLRKPEQIIQPWMFGDKASKTTCLWLKDLPKLIPQTKEKPELEYWISPSGKRMEMWMYKVRCHDAKSGLRANLASKTFTGIAKAMAEQWSEYLLNPPIKSTLF